MSKFWVIFMREYAQVVKKKSFIIGIVLTPLMMGAFMLLPAFLASRESSSSELMAVVDRGNEQIGQQFASALERYTIGDTEQQAYEVTEIFEVPAGDDELFTAVYDSLAGAITAKELRYFLVINAEPDKTDSGLYLVSNSESFRAYDRFERRLTDILSRTRLDASNINLPVDSILALTQRLDLPIRDTKGESIPFIVKYFAALILVMMIFIMIIGYGQILMRSVIEEKTSRIVEVLVSSVTPFQLMFGKVLGLGAAAFTQVAVWVAMGAVIFLYSGSMSIDISPSVGRMVFNPVIVMAFVGFFILGYLMFSTIYALIGSIVTNDKEAQPLLAPVNMLLIAPVIIGMAVIQNPYATWVMVLSYIPLLSPTLMLMRTAFIAPTVTEYSLTSGILGEVLLAFLVVAIFTVFVIWLSAKIFRVGIFMTGKRATLPEIMKWVRR